MGLARTWVREGTGAIVADVPVDTPNARAAAAAFQEVRALLAAGGVPPRGVTLRHYHPDDPRAFAAITLNYPRIAAVAGPCGLWPDDLGPSILNRDYTENRDYYNFGCAYQRNMAAMIDNPSDLVQPRAGNPGVYGAAHRSLREVSQGRDDHDHLSRIREGQTQRHRQMIRNARQDHDELPDSPPPHADDYIAPAPRVSVQAFCETAETATAVQSAAQDRRLGKAHVTVKMGGVVAAIEAYSTVPTPNVIILETEGGSDILAGLDELAGVCDPGTRVVVIGTAQRHRPYRELVRRGVSDYVIGPVNPLDVVRSICSLFSATEAIPVGRTIAVVGAKGGVGASTVAHNVAWAIARDLALDSVVIDLDLAFGTASLDYNQDPVQGIANAVLLSRPARYRGHGAPAGEMHRSSQPAGGTGDAGAGLRFRRRRLQLDFRHPAHDDALHRAGRSPPMVGMDQAHAGRRG